MGLEADVEKAPLLKSPREASPDFPPSSVFAFAALAFTYCFFAWARQAPSRELVAAAGLAGLSLIKRQVIYAVVFFLGEAPRGLARPPSPSSATAFLASIPEEEASPEGASAAGSLKAGPSRVRALGVLVNRAVDLALWTAALRGGLATGGVVAAALAPVMATLAAAAAARGRRGCLAGAFPEIRASGQDSLHAQIAELIAYLLSLTLWSSVLCPHFLPEEYPVLLHIICLPAAVGGTLAGIANAVGRWVVNVQGLEELTRKTVEGCATMFFLTGAACVAAVTAQRSVLQTFEYSAWLQISGVVTFVSTVVELLSSWETLICTVSCSASLVLFAWTY